MTSTAIVQVELDPTTADSAPKGNEHWVRTVLKTPRGYFATGYLALLILAGVFAGTLSAHTPAAWPY